jgi:hypothetical protein
MWSHILKPYFSSIGESLEQGDFMGATGKTVIGMLAGSLVLGFNPFSLALGTFSSGLSLATSGMVSIALNPFAMAAIALGASFGAVTYAINNLQTEIDRSAQITTKQVIEERKKIKTLDGQLKELVNKPELTYAEKLQKFLLESDKKRTKEHIQFEQKLRSVEAENSGWWDSFTNAFTGNVDKKLKDISDEYHNKVEIAESTRASIMEELSKMTNDASAWYNKTESQASKEADDIVKSILEQRKNNIEPVDDAIIVQPHSKDQILMGKTGGPFDLALKRMIEKIEDEQKILAEGFAMLVDATLSGAGQVSQTVAATAGASSSGSISSNRNPVADFRSKALGRIRQ